MMTHALRHLTEKERVALALFVSLLRSAMGDNLIRIALFGSKARGDYVPDSDLDVLVILRDDNIWTLDKIAEITADINLEYNIALSPAIFSEYEYIVNRNMRSPFTLAVESEGIRL